MPTRADGHSLNRHSQGSNQASTLKSLAYHTTADCVVQAASHPVVVVQHFPVGVRHAGQPAIVHAARPMPDTLARLRGQVKRKRVASPFLFFHGYIFSSHLEGHRLSLLRSAPHLEQRLLDRRVSNLRHVGHDRELMNDKRAKRINTGMITVSHITGVPPNKNTQIVNTLKETIKAT
jgi:hypothetical protein